MPGDEEDAPIAVALQYEKDAGSAPMVVAKGVRFRAEQILAIAKEAGIPIMKNIPLANALIRVEVGEEIPEELYDAVAEVLNFVYALQGEAERQKR